MIFLDNIKMCCYTFRHEQAYRLNASAPFITKDLITKCNIVHEMKNMKKNDFLSYLTYPAVCRLCAHDYKTKEQFKGNELVSFTQHLAERAMVHLDTLTVTLMFFFLNPGTFNVFLPGNCSHT